MAVLRDEIERLEKLASLTPEDCYLAAWHTGDGWALAVKDANRGVVAYLAWPSSFGQEQTAAQLREKGFTIE